MRSIKFILIILQIQLATMSCSENQSSGSDAYLDNNLVGAATETSIGFNESAIGEPSEEFSTVPREKWASEIEAMDPIVVYSHYNNIAIVLVDKEATQEGIYVNVSFSSYLPTNTDQIQYTKIENGIYEFSRMK